MTNQPPSPLLPLQADAPVVPLPKTLMLSYIGRDTTAPRLRRTITWSLRILATLNAAISLALLSFITSIIYQRFTLLAMYGHPTPLLEALSQFGGHIAITIPVVILTAALAITFFVGAGPASRGSHVAAALVTLGLIPYFFLLPVATAMSCTVAILLLLDAHPQPSAAALFVVLPVGLPAVLLLKDLVTCITWASNNPTEEKPKTPFLPSRSSKPQSPP